MASNLCTLASKSFKRAAILKFLQPTAAYHGKNRIGKREIVGFGINGEYTYIDRCDCPMPAIRFREDTPEVTKLREKEKGDWKSLTLEEKKTLYRSSFRLTFSEQRAPTGDWKYMIGGTLIFMSLAIWAYMFLKKFVYPPMPYSLTPEHQQKMLMTMLDLNIDPVQGLSSKYDRENKKWK